MMKTSLTRITSRLPVLLATCALLASGMASAPATARDDRHLLSIEDAMNANDARTKLEGVKFYFGNAGKAKVIKKLGTEQISEKTNSVGKSAETACNWAFLSAMLKLHKRAEQFGANAVINIKSNYKHREFSSATEFECHDGAIITGVAFKAEFVRIADK